MGGGPSTVPGPYFGDRSRLIDINPLPPISDGLTGFSPLTPTREAGVYQGSGNFGSWVFLTNSVRNGSYITASWNEDRRILRAWFRDCAERSNVWQLYEIGPIPTNYFFGNGWDENRNITFRNCCAGPCPDRCYPVSNLHICRRRERPNWVRRVAPQPGRPNVTGVHSPCPNTRENVPCYLREDPDLRCF
jgi:hypothetical protein